MAELVDEIRPPANGNLQQVEAPFLNLPAPRRRQELKDSLISMGTHEGIGDVLDQLEQGRQGFELNLPALLLAQWPLLQHAILCVQGRGQQHRHDTELHGNVGALLDGAAPSQSAPEQEAELHVLLRAGEHDPAGLPIGLLLPGAGLRKGLRQHARLHQVLPVCRPDGVFAKQRHEARIREHLAILLSLRDVHEQHHDVVPENLVLEAVPAREHGLHEAPEALNDLLLA
mmetsp:Transcript_127666/g.367403  ORF Transcript_127666/g.367403 Transcript_127666/m.367403 type:complete len:229 (+) Transcript_127666:1288-1974(+)